MSNPADTTVIEREIRAKALRRVHAKLGLMWHFAVFVMANLAMFEIDQHFTPNNQWFVWPLSAWSVGLALHAFSALSGGGLTDDMLRGEIEKERRRRGLA
jgi:2TM domain